MFSYLTTGVYTCIEEIAVPINTIFSAHSFRSLLFFSLPNMLQLYKTTDTPKLMKPHEIPTSNTNIYLE